MARLQILELPQGDGDDRPPFILVIDQAPPTAEAFDALRRDLLSDGDLAPRLGARAVLCFEETIEIPANEVPVDPEGYPVRIRVEGDFEQFREQVQEEIRQAQRAARMAGQWGPR